MHTFRLTVTDSLGLQSVSDLVVITITEEETGHTLYLPVMIKPDG